MLAASAAVENCVARSARMTVALRCVIVCPLHVKLYSTATTALLQTPVAVSKDGAGGTVNPLSKEQRAGVDGMFNQETESFGHL